MGDRGRKDSSTASTGFGQRASAAAHASESGGREVSELAVMHLVDTLSVGGTERVAVNITNQLGDRKAIVPSCARLDRRTTFAACLANVGRLSLGRTRTFELGAVRRLARFIQENEIRRLACPRLVDRDCESGIAHVSAFLRSYWHDHFGTNERQSDRFGFTASWSNVWPELSPSAVRWPIGHFAGCVFPAIVFGASPTSLNPLDATGHSTMELPGSKGSRVICVANLRPVKDHLMLLRAMKRVVSQGPMLTWFSSADFGPGMVDRNPPADRDRSLTENVTIMGIVRRCSRNPRR